MIKRKMITSIKSPACATAQLENMAFPLSEAIAFFAALFYGEHHTPEIKPFGMGWCVMPYDRSLSTFDFNGMTRLVLLAHDRCIRAEVSMAGMKLRIAIHKRHGRDGEMSHRHPTIESAIESIRESRYYRHGLSD
jgi:hypothetical protein